MRVTFARLVMTRSGIYMMMIGCSSAALIMTGFSCISLLYLKRMAECENAAAVVAVLNCYDYFMLSVVG
jgi:hypothetical protein